MLPKLSLNWRNNFGTPMMMHVGSVSPGVTAKQQVKELLTVLLQAAGPVHATAGNYNNELGVPLTILGTPPGCRHVVVEMGAGRQGDIRYLASIARPQIGIITSIGPAHLDGFGTIEGVAQGRKLHIAVVDGGPCYSEGSGSPEQAQVQHILEQAANGRDLLVVDEDHLIADQVVDSQGPDCRFGDIGVPLHGRHNAANLRLALRVARDRGLSVGGLQQGLRQLRPVAGRLVEVQWHHHTILDDSYNANPASMEAGLHELARRAGGRIAVLGAMAELGPESDALHRPSWCPCCILGFVIDHGCCRCDCRGIPGSRRSRCLGDGRCRAGRSAT